MWKPADRPPAGEPGKWTREVVVVTNFDDVFRLPYFTAAEGEGHWQTADRFTVGEKVAWWYDAPGVCEQELAPTLQQALDSIEDALHGAMIDECDGSLRLLRQWLPGVAPPCVDEEQDDVYVSSPGDKFYEALGWMHAECCAALDRGEDPRDKELPEMVARCEQDLSVQPEEPQEPDWEIPIAHLERCEAAYAALGTSGYFALNYVIRPLRDRLTAGERTDELYREIMDVKL